MWLTLSTGGVLRTSGRDPLGAPDFFHAVLDSFREFGFRGSLGEGRRVPRRSQAW